MNLIRSGRCWQSGNRWAGELEMVPKIAAKRVFGITPGLLPAIVEEAAETERCEINRAGAPIGDEFGHTLSDRWTLLEARAAEAKHQIEAIQAGRAVKDRVGVGRHVV